MKKYILSLYLALLSPLAGNEIVTNPLRTDGFGAQFQTIIYSVIYAELNGKNYTYTTFKNMEHNYENDPDFLNRKEWLINFINFFPINTDETLQKKISPRDYITFFESNLNTCANSESLKKIKQIFRANKDKNNYFSNSNFNIAIHIRRPNPHDSRIDGTNTQDQVYIDIIERLRAKYSAQAPLFHIYSQGDLESFKHQYTGDDIIFHLNESIEDTFTSMVLAEVLVTSRSSFSYAAALLSEGTVYYLRFWHPPLPGWIEF